LAIPGWTEEAVLETADRLRNLGFIDASQPEGGDGSIDFFSPDMTMIFGNTGDMMADKEIENVRAELRKGGFFVSIARRAARQIPPANGDRYLILVIEDDPQLANMYDKLISMMGCRAVLAGNHAAIEAALKMQERPDLILLDLNLPDVGGLSILHWLSTHSRMGATPVIVASADTTKESIVRSLALGADGYITKPISVDSLTDSIRTALGLPPVDRSKENEWTNVVG